MITVPFPIRKECPPGACVCRREELLANPDADIRILRLTREEEKRLLARLENLSSYDDLLHMQKRMYELLGMRLNIAPRSLEVRSVRGLTIELIDQPGLCKKTRQSVPAAIRRCFEQRPEIVYALLDAHGLLGQSLPLPAADEGVPPGTP